MLLVIREAELVDIKQIIEIENSCFEEEDRFDNVLFYLFVKRRNREIFLVAELTEGSEKKIIGFIVAILTSECDYEIATLNVHPDWRRMGIGEKLMLSMENSVMCSCVKSLNANNKNRINEMKIELTVYDKNITAICLYEKLNYQVVGKIPNYYRKDRDGIRMVKKLPLNENACN